MSDSDMQHSRLEVAYPLRSLEEVMAELTFSAPEAFDGIQLRKQMEMSEVLVIERCQPDHPVGVARIRRLSVVPEAVLCL